MKSLGRDGRQILVGVKRFLTNLVNFKFAIRPNIRNSNQLSRDAVITQIASAVGPQHTVDLKAYDLLIIVEIYKVRTRASCRSFCKPGIKDSLRPAGDALERLWHECRWQRL